MNFEHLAQLIELTCYVIIVFVALQIFPVMFFLKALRKFILYLLKPKRKVNIIHIDMLQEQIDDLEKENTRIWETHDNAFSFLNERLLKCEQKCKIKR